MTDDRRAPTLVVGGILHRDGRVFLARRAPGRRHGSLWELPGGKVEPGEDPRDALARELLEELGVRCRVGDLVSDSSASTDGADHRFLAFEAFPDGEPSPGDSHDAAAWFDRDGLPSEPELAPLDPPALRAWLAAAAAKAAGNAGRTQ